MSTAQEQNELDQTALAALAKVRLNRFTAEPLAIAPFASSKISWEVAIPEDSDVSVDIDLNGTPVATSGAFLVAPESTASYLLRAHALNYSRVLGTVTVHVDLEACIVPPPGEPVYLITAIIKHEINTGKSGIRFRSTSDPIVAIRDNQMIISLRLTKHVSLFVDVSIDVDASFALDVVPIPRQGRGQILAGISPFEYDFHKLAPKDESITIVVTPAWYTKIITGPLLIVYEGPYREMVAKMISDIVELLNGWYHQSNVQPPKMDKHDASFYVNPHGDQLFWINFCPVPTIVNAP